eukprot:CAMPEP_0118944918 /NCGR_PEP_ID=MMETSP1169-20130426/41282_1 /TAXON_ID=36882 /ORGANISM="Pyramimonas obovata, Strain CCMP722" /LENGTH=99 /DNA_ID=CAMNT_0006890517 /DNA_START=128 /DNA_END=423 /DNA_ORIENTATION=-
MSVCRTHEAGHCSSPAPKRSVVMGETRRLSLHTNVDDSTYTLLIGTPSRLCRQIRAVQGLPSYQPTTTSLTSRRRASSSSSLLIAQLIFAARMARLRPA